jgi:replicative superfamily II helicase
MTTQVVSLEEKYENFVQIKTDYPVTAKFLAKMYSHLPSWNVHWYQIEYIIEIELSIREGKNTLIAMPTGMGKTMALFFATLTGRTIYVSPSVALTEEKYDELPANFPTYSVLRDIGADREARRETPEAFDYENQDVIVTTNERLLYMITGNDRDRIFDGVDFIVFDEIHKVGNIGRGSALDLFLIILERQMTKDKLNSNS